MVFEQGETARWGSTYGTITRVPFRAPNYAVWWTPLAGGDEVMFSLRYGDVYRAFPGPADGEPLMSTTAREREALRLAGAYGTRKNKRDTPEKHESEVPLDTVSQTR